MKNNHITVYIVIINKVLKRAYIKQKNQKSVDTLKAKYEADKDNFYPPKKVRALSVDDAFIKACKALEIDSELFEIDRTKMYNLEEVEDFDF